MSTRSFGASCSSPCMTGVMLTDGPPQCSARGEHDAAFAKEAFGVLLASDCMYDRDATPKLCRMLAAVCTPDTLVLLAYKKRILECVTPAACVAAAST